MAEMNESAPRWGYRAQCFPAFHGDEMQSTSPGITAWIETLRNDFLDVWHYTTHLTSLNLFPHQLSRDIDPTALSRGLNEIMCVKGYYILKSTL